MDSNLDMVIFQKISIFFKIYFNFSKHVFLGVLDDIIAGEKYMGMWSNNEKSGQGCVVNFNGIYCEGIFRYVFLFDFFHTWYYMKIKGQLISKVR